ncbi:MAG: aldo/keto reductase [Pedosphaera sp.]|nr:aldo/keto reductase [Pedosphaera sp.]
MKTKSLGNSDLQITPIGFGAWAIGGDWKFGWGAQDDGDSIAAIHRALELGINWIDTAAAYGLGHSEEVVARALADWPHERPFVFTKCGILGDGKGDVRYSLKAESIRAEAENSLRRLKVETIDLYQIHWPADELSETEEGWQIMAGLQTEGKVRWIGASNFSVQELEAAQRIAPVTSLQPPYSLIKREAENELLPYCQKQNIGVIAYSPMGSGLLTGAMTRERLRKLPREDWRTQYPEFQEPRLTQNLALVERLRAVGDRHGRTPGEVAIAWTLRQPAITGAIVGARRPEQLNGIIGAADFRLSPEEIAEVEGAVEIPAHA